MRKTRFVLGATLAIALVVTPLAYCAEPPSGPVEPTGNDLPEDTNWKAVTVTGGLMHPWSIAWLPDGETMLVTEREGRLRVIEDGELRGEPVEGLPDDIAAVGQGGLLDLKLHPDFEDNRLIYFAYARGDQRENHTVLGRARINEDLTDLEDFQVIFEVNRIKRGGQHFGSRLLWLPDGSLLMAIGDGGNPPVKLDGELIRNYAQDLSAHLGKTVRMDDAGEPMPDNPFAGDDDPDTDPYVYSYGHRNIQGLALHPETDEIWASEHGARGGDELNVIEKGENYGWPIATYSAEYSGPRITDQTTHEGTLQPEVVWTPCIAPSGLTFYTGDAFPEWKGDLLAGGLVLRQIRRVHFDDGDIVDQTTLQFDDRIRDVVMGPDGGLYVLTDEIDGRLLRLEPKE
ncbi:MAG: PQQ-dependent sugar dehydrogenase [Phycisphaeraceae bacterium]